MAQPAWLYAPAGCDHAVEFPRRAVERALHVDVGEATTFSAECVELGGEVRSEDRARMLEIAEALLRRSAERLRLKLVPRRNELAGGAGAARVAHASIVLDMFLFCALMALKAVDRPGRALWHAPPLFGLVNLDA